MSNLCALKQYNNGVSCENVLACLLIAWNKLPGVESLGKKGYAHIITILNYDNFS